MAQATPLELHQTELNRLQRIAQNAGFFRFHRGTLPLAEVYFATGETFQDGNGSPVPLHWAGIWGAAGVARRVDAPANVTEDRLIQIMTDDAANFLTLADTGMLMQGGKVRLG